MLLKVFGAIIIVLSCGGYGILLAISHRKEVCALHMLVRTMDVMICELEYRLTPLPELCKVGSEQSNGPISEYFSCLADILDHQYFSDVGICSTSALKKTTKLPPASASQLQSLGQTLGRFDFDGQMKSLEQCKQSCIGQLEVLEHQQTQRLRSYQTLGFCAGVALAILLF